MQKKLLPILTLARIDVKRLFRDKVAIFFTFVFPLIFLIVFGGIFGRNDDVSFKVGLLNNSNSKFAADFAEKINESEILDVDKDVTSLDKAEQKMNRGEINATIILPEGFGEVKNGKYPSGEAQILYDQNDSQAGETLSSVFEGMFKDINSRFIDTPTPFSVKAVSTATKGLTQFDYIFSGLLGFVILTLGIFGPTAVFPRLKQRGVLRRYHTTTMKVWQYFTANVISNAIVGLMSITVMFMVGLVIFDLNMRGDYLNLIIMSIIGLVLLFGIGLAVGGWAKNENQAAPLANLITFPMMFLSGVFFPTFLMPEWLQAITRFIPLTPVVDGLRLVITEGQTILALGSQLAIIGGWMLIIYAVAFRVFRWE
ncbi:MAG TPA: ABC transporter permease [Candidatus Saccharimonadales bacterium]|nr:ABC transporter permease [Candidatus Saccharimonadales bacterium]